MDCNVNTGNMSPRGLSKQSFIALLLFSKILNKALNILHFATKYTPFAKLCHEFHMLVLIKTVKKNLNLNMEHYYAKSTSYHRKP